MPHYVLERNETPKGDRVDVESDLNREGKLVLAIFREADIHARSFLPSPDLKRFAGVEEVEINLGGIPGLIRRLENVGYNLTGPFPNASVAYTYWFDGKR